MPQFREQRLMSRRPVGRPWARCRAEARRYAPETEALRGHREKACQKNQKLRACNVGGKNTKKGQETLVGL
jgi:hypothetical protein